MIGLRCDTIICTARSLVWADGNWVQTKLA